MYFPFITLKGKSSHMASWVASECGCRHWREGEVAGLEGHHFLQHRLEILPPKLASSSLKHKPEQPAAPPTAPDIQ